MNFGDDEMKIDTFLHQMRKRSEKIVQAGDDTWKMFRLFERQYANRDSLFVNDFYEGDRNVTDSLRFELKRNDWKLLILRKRFDKESARSITFGYFQIISVWITLGMLKVLLVSSCHQSSRRWMM